MKPNSYHLQISGIPGDGHWILSQQGTDDAFALETAERLLAQSHIAAAARHATLWSGELGPTARCVAAWDLRATVTLDRNSRRETQIARERDTGEV